ncbi:hypothetical protein SAMN05421543_14211 [Alicyclobacillus macrosporangiidus]|uniref:Uncharacterized protein n=1 Tax=Alicyclobacillus macrosporangiidus TaxID=392015 RepID=A0A1I7LES1_9BACL|nr:hypothetical protein SAMN05421543_14211 [Alicyclobacillus macrosporangiidus]
MLLRVLEQGQEDGGFAKRVAEEVGRWLLEQGIGASRNTDMSGQEDVEQDVPHNPVISFLQRWDDE